MNNAELQVFHLFSCQDELPMVVSAVNAKCSLRDSGDELRNLVSKHLLSTGGLLFRRFDVGGGIEGFHDFAKSFGHSLEGLSKGLNVDFVFIRHDVSLPVEGKL
ncbi:hypothetical protein [Oceanobacter antarcticus]|uniref:Uncharacterized protein n=1 Tax=Oceanobacter antarcticus TaxID=3133425 RepID=A0ABW8NNN8_9GAMM